MKGLLPAGVVVVAFAIAAIAQAEDAVPIKKNGPTKEVADVTGNSKPEENAVVKEDSGTPTAELLKENDNGPKPRETDPLKRDKRTFILSFTKGLLLGKAIGLAAGAHYGAYGGGYGGYGGGYGGYGGYRGYDSYGGYGGYGGHGGYGGNGGYGGYGGGYGGAYSNSHSASSSYGWGGGSNSYASSQAGSYGWGR